MPTQPQLSLLTDLFLERQVHPAIQAEFERQLAAGMTNRTASAWISIVKETQPVKENA